MKFTHFILFVVTMLVSCIKPNASSSVQSETSAPFPFAVNDIIQNLNGLYTPSILDGSLNPRPDAPKIDLLNEIRDQLISAMENSHVLARSFSDSTQLFLKFVIVKKVSTLTYCDSVSAAASANATAPAPANETKTDTASQTETSAAEIPPKLPCGGVVIGSTATTTKTDSKSVGKVSAGGQFYYKYTVSRYSVRFTFIDLNKAKDSHGTDPASTLNGGIAKDFPTTADIEVFDNIDLAWSANISMSAVLSLPEGLRQIVATKWADIQTIEAAATGAVERQRHYAFTLASSMLRDGGSGVSPFQGALVKDIVRPLCSWAATNRNLDKNKVCAPITDPRVVTALSRIEDSYLNQSDVMTLTGCKPSGTHNIFLLPIYLLYFKVPPERNRFKKGDTLYLFHRVENGWERQGGTANKATADGESFMDNCVLKPYVQVGDKCLVALFTSPLGVLSWGEFPKSFGTVCNDINSGQTTSLGISLVSDSFVRDEENKALPVPNKPVPAGSN